MTDTRATYVAHDIPDLLSSLPTLFGFRPAESLVAVATHGPRRRFGFRLRMDLPPPEDVDQVAALVVSHLVNQGAEGAVVIVLTDDQETALDLLDAVHAELDDADGIELVVRARATADRYWTDQAGSPPDGRPYRASGHHVSIVQAVAVGQQILPDRAALVERFAAVVGERRRWLELATEAILDEIVPVVARTAPDDLAATGFAVVEPIWARAMRGSRLSDADVLRFAAWTSSIGVRDAVWATMTRDNAPDVLSALTAMCTTVVPPFEPAVLSLTAFAAWLTGDGAQALIATERALQSDPQYSMARLILEILERGVSPMHWEGFGTSHDSMSAPG